LIYLITIPAMLLAVSIGLACAFRGPTLFDRVLSANMIGTVTVLMVALLGFMTGRPAFLDIALVYVLISFVSTIAVLRIYTCNDRVVCNRTLEPGQDDGQPH